MPNPYLSPSTESVNRGIYADHARLLSSAFLYREIEFDLPYPLSLVYSGWWFWQRVSICDERVWSQVSWLAISRKVEFTLPASITPELVRGQIEIDFGHALRIRRFRVWFNDSIAYDEIA